MNVQEYISSGIVESYVLGMASASEREEFERMCELHPEVREARDAFETSLEEFAMMNQTAPAKNIKSRVFASIDIESASNGKDEEFNSFTTNPSRQFRPQATVRSMAWERYVAAASIVLLLLSTALNFYFFNKYREYNKRYEELVISQTELATHNQVLETRLLGYEKAVDMMKDPNMAVVKMPAISGSPDPSSATTVYWDTLSKDVYLAVNKLPEPLADQQYQLWAMVDGVPVNAGVFDIDKGPGFVKMKNIPRAQAFAVTLEKKGGSPKPSMDKLYVMGKM